MNIYKSYKTFIKPDYSLEVMIKLSEFKIIEDAYFKTHTNYYKPSLYPFLAKNFTENQKFSPNTIIKLQKLIPKKIVLAHDKILDVDFKQLIKNIKGTPKDFDEETWKGMVPEIQKAVEKHLGLQYKPRDIFFNEQFPFGLIGFEKKGASSVTLFEGQKGTGIYFLNKRLSSLFTPVLFIHEQIHTCLSQNKTKDQIYIEWFEEGLAQWFSLKIYYDITKNLDILKYYNKRSYVYNLTQPEYNFTRRYFEYMKIMALIYLQGGPKLLGTLLTEYLQNNREEVNKYLNTDNFKAGYLPNDKFENLMVKFTVQVEPEKVTPLEFLILKSVLRPKKLETLMNFLEAPKERLEKSIFSLQVKGMVIIKGDLVEINWRKRDLFENNLIKAIYPFN